MTRSSSVPALAWVALGGVGVGVVVLWKREPGPLVVVKQGTDGKAAVASGSPVIDAISNAVRGLEGTYEVVDVRGPVSGMFARGRRFVITQRTVEWSGLVNGAATWEDLGDQRLNVTAAFLPVTAIWSYSWEGHSLLLHDRSNGGVATLAPRPADFVPLDAWHVMQAQLTAERERDEAAHAKARAEQDAAARREEEERAEEIRKAEEYETQTARSREQARVGRATDELGALTKALAGAADPRRFVESLRRVDEIRAAWAGESPRVSVAVRDAYDAAEAARSRVIRDGMDRARQMVDAGEAVEVVAALEEIGVELSAATREALGPALYARLEEMRERRGR